MALIEVLLSPLRLRIIHAVMDGRPFTTAHLSERFPDVSKATVYRQVAVLADAGLLTLEGEERIRGAVERTYRFRKPQGAMDQETMAALTVADHQRLFAAALGGLLAEFGAYLGKDEANPYADSVSYRQFSLWLSDGEKAELISAIAASLRVAMTNEPAADRRQHMLSTILFPTGDPLISPRVPNSNLDRALHHSARPGPRCSAEC